MFDKKDYTYILPPDCIAEEAIHPHHDARLMIVDKDTGKIAWETTFWDLDTYLPEDTVIFFNNSRVIRSRIVLENVDYILPNWQKKILNEGEIFFLKRIQQDTFEALIRPGNKFKIGTIFCLDNYRLEIIWISDSGRIIQIHTWDIITEKTIPEFLEIFWALPLPPYIEYKKEKEKDYQTVFAEKDWSVAAPTASLHFTKELLNKLPNEKKYITLHVGLGTFKWIDTQDIRDYSIHSERSEISTQILVDIAKIKWTKKHIVAVGTTACRTLESLPALWAQLDQNIKDAFEPSVQDFWNSVSESVPNNTWIAEIAFDKDAWNIIFLTSIYITPGYNFQIVDDLITNFHLPESSLLVLVSAIIWRDNTMNLYKKAIDTWYRFYSFWDAMYIRWK